MRDPARMLPIRAPFGGLVTTTDAGAVSPNDCIDCLNVHTKGGTIQKRPGYASHSSLGGGSGAILASLVINNQLALYNGIDTGPSTAHRLIDQSGATLYTFASNRNLPWGVADLFGKVYLVTGDPSISRKVYHDGSNYVNQRLGISAPTAAPGVSDGGSGSLPAGTYSYRYSYYNQPADVESAVGPAASVTIAGSHRVTVIPVGTADTQVTHMRVYRMLVGTDSVWYRVATVPVATYDDNSATIAKTAETQAKEVGDVPPISNIIARHQQRMWYGVGTFARDVRPSERNAPELVNPLGGYRVTDDERDRLVVMKSAFGALWCFNTDSIWVISGSDLSDFTSSKVVAGVGCFARYSLVEIEGALYFADRKGVYRFDGSSIDRVSAAIDATWESLFDLTLPDAIFAAFDPITRCYVITGNNNTTHAFDRNLAYQVDTGRWYIWNLPACGMTTHTASISGAINRKRLHFAHANSGIRVLHASKKTDIVLGVETPIDWHWQTPHSAFGTPRIKHGYFVHVEHEPSPEADTLVVQHSTDRGSLTSLGTTPLNGRNHKAFVLGRMGRSLSIKLSGSSSGNPDISAISVEADPVGAF